MPNMREVDDVPEGHDIGCRNGTLRQLTGIILIEGVDGTGKTTLARTLQQVSSHRALFHAGPPQTASAFREYVRPLELANDGWTIICDRWHLGEMVWPTIFGRESMYTPGTGALSFNWIEEHIKAIGVPVTAIFLQRDLEGIIAELYDRKEATDYIEHATQLYNDAIGRSAFNWNVTSLWEVLDGESLCISG